MPRLNKKHEATSIDVASHRRRVRKLMAEQTEFGIVATLPLPKFKQTEFPIRKERLTKKIVPFTAGAQ